MKILVFLGSTRDSTPPQPARLGWRVAQTCLQQLQADCQPELVDPMTLQASTRFKPHFAYPRSQVPSQLDTLAEQISHADGYVMISPEYNHSMSPALAHLLNHFGSSLFAFKPSAIVTYSAGQWGGTRAAVAMRTFLSELGCLPVSAMIHMPRAAEVVDEQGCFQTDKTAWQGYMARTFNQLLWWAHAAQKQRQIQDPASISPAFQTRPSQRNAP